MENTFFGLDVLHFEKLITTNECACAKPDIDFSFDAATFRRINAYQFLKSKH